MSAAGASRGAGQAALRAHASVAAVTLAGFVTGAIGTAAWPAAATAQGEPAGSAVPSDDDGRRSPNGANSDGGRGMGGDDIPPPPPAYERSDPGERARDPASDRTPLIPPDRSRPVARYPVPRHPSSPAADAPAPAEPESGANLVALDVLSLAVHFERSFASWLTLYAGPRAFLFGFGDSFRDDDVFTVGLDLGLRFFVVGRAPEGFWFSPNGGLGFASVDSSLGDAEQTLGWWAGGLAGYTWIFGRSFVLSVGGGANYVDMTARFGGVRFGFRGALLAARAAVGWSF